MQRIALSQAGTTARAAVTDGPPTCRVAATLLPPFAPSPIRTGRAGRPTFPRDPEAASRCDAYCVCTLPLA
jgi:hypothetical protein